MAEVTGVIFNTVWCISSSQEIKAFLFLDEESWEFISPHSKNLKTEICSVNLGYHLTYSQDLSSSKVLKFRLVYVPKMCLSNIVMSLKLDIKMQTQNNCHRTNYLRLEVSGISSET